MADGAVRGLLVTFEGPEGAGKSTQVVSLAERVRAAGRSVTTTREPGGTTAGEVIRGVLLDDRHGAVSPLAEALLFCAARAELVARVVRPALSVGTVVVCDRYNDSTMAYQGHGRGVPLGWLADVILGATGGLVPDLTLLLDLPVELGLERRRASGGEWNRLDGAGLAFHQRVRDGYLALAAAEPDRITVIAAADSPDTVAAAVWRAVEPRLGVP